MSRDRPLRVGRRHPAHSDTVHPRPVGQPRPDVAQRQQKDTRDQRDADPTRHRNGDSTTAPLHRADHRIPRRRHRNPIYPKVNT